jgi:recombination associated protein RdgC
MFKNAIPFRLTGAVDLYALHASLSVLQAREPGVQEFTTTGFVAPDKNRPDELFRRIGQAYFIKLKTVDRVLPSAVINDAVAKKVAEIEDREARKVSKKERTTLKDETIFELLPKAFTKSSFTEAFIDTGANLIVVNAASYKKAEDVVSMLRKALGTLPARPINPVDNPRVSMSLWTLDPDSTPDKFKHGGKYALVAPDETAKKSRFSEYAPNEITEVLGNGSQVVSMAMEWDESLRFVFESDFRLKGIKDIQTAEIQEENEDPFEVDCIITHDLITRVFGELIKAFGGEKCLS